MFKLSFYLNCTVTKDKLTFFSQEVTSLTSIEASIFISYYFKHQLRTKINCVPRHDDGGEVSSSK
jgi:hypothetical protein